MLPYRSVMRSNWMIWWVWQWYESYAMTFTVTTSQPNRTSMGDLGPKHQNTKWIYMFWKNAVPPSSRITEICGILKSTEAFLVAYGGPTQCMLKQTSLYHMLSDHVWKQKCLSLFWTAKLKGRARNLPSYTGEMRQTLHLIGLIMFITTLQGSVRRCGIPEAQPVSANTSTVTYPQGLDCAHDHFTTYYQLQVQRWQTLLTWSWNLPWKFLFFFLVNRIPWWDMQNEGEETSDRQKERVFLWWVSLRSCQKRGILGGGGGGEDPSCPSRLQRDEGWRDEGMRSLVRRRLCQGSRGWGRALTNYSHLLQTQLKPG